MPQIAFTRCMIDYCWDFLCVYFLCHGCY